MIFSTDFKAKSHITTNYWRGTGALCFSTESSQFFVSTKEEKGFNTFTVTLDNAIFASNEYTVNLVLKILEKDLNELTLRGVISVFICSLMIAQIKSSNINLKNNVKFIKSKI